MKRFKTDKKKRPSSKYSKRDDIFNPNKRMYVVLSITIIILIALLARIAYLQFVKNDYLVYEADRRTLNEVTLPVMRATIKDRDGKALAVSVPMYNLWANPKLIQQNNYFQESDPKWHYLATLLNQNFSEIESKVSKKTASFVYLAKQITPEMMEQIRSLKLKGIGFDRTARRFYPYSQATAQLIGVTQMDNESDGVGIEGIEKLFNDQLMGKSGKVINRGSRRGKVVEEIASIEGESGLEVDLSINIRLQNIVYETLASAVEANKADSGTAVLIDIATGDILAMVSAPSFNPNYRSVVNLDSMRNRAVTDQFEPGSTVKPFIVALALDKKIANEKTVIDTRPMLVDKFTVKDVSYNKELDLEGILVKSSNVGVTRLALAMEGNDVVSFYQSVGLGVDTNLGLNGERSGKLETRQHWAKSERATHAYGYGFMVTPLQLARAYATLGRGGINCDVNIEKTEQPQNCQRVISEKTARTVLNYMHKVAENNQHLMIPGYSVGIKTGTAKKISNSGKYENNYIAYTVGVAPINDPKYALMVMIDNPTGGNYYGGIVSAPIFGKIMGSVLRAMNVPPDQNLDEPSGHRHKK